MLLNFSYGKMEVEMKKTIILIAAGILLLAVDIRVPAGEPWEPYPQMAEAQDLGKELQTKVINHFIGARPSMDIVSDLLAYIILFIGALLLVRKSRRMIFALLLIPAAVYLYITIPRLAYRYEARELYLKSAGYNFLIVIIEILIEFFIIHGIVTLTDCMQNKWYNNELLGGFFAAMISKGILVAINFFFGHNLLFYAYSVVLIGLTLYYLSRLYMTTKFEPEVKA